MAGEVSKDIARRKLIPAHIVQAHDEGCTTLPRYGLRNATDTQLYA